MIPPDGRSEDDEAAQQQVRRLLGDLAASDERDPAPVPEDVAARLDAALAGLTPVRTLDPAPDPAPVTPLRRRRSRLGPVLATAAVVALVAGGAVAVGNGVGGGANDSAAGGSSASSAGDESAAESAPEAGSGDQDGQDTQDSEDLASSPGSSADAGGGRMLPAPYLTRAGFPDDVAALIRDGEVATADAPRAAAERQRVEGSGCVVPPAAQGAATLVMLEGDPAVLVVAEPIDGDREVTLLACAEGDEIARGQVRVDDTGR